MNMAFWLKNWRKFFPKKSALVIDYKLLIEVMRRVQHKDVVIGRTKTINEGA